MYEVFYLYAGFHEPKIDKQLIRTALDNWGWFWVGVEAAFLLGLTSVILRLVDAQWQLRTSLLLLLVNVVILMVLQWPACRRSAGREVEAILDDPEREAGMTAIEIEAALESEGEHAVEALVARAERR